MNRYNNSNILKTDKGIKYYSSILYPEIKPKEDDIYIITAANDRLDLIANDYYGDVTLWPIIYFANPDIGLKRYSVFVEPGIQIRIPDPNDINEIINKLEQVNRSR